MKVYNIPEKYKFPKGLKVAEMREKVYLQGSAKDIKKYFLPDQCKDGWYVVDMVQTDDKRIILTLGKPE